MLFDLPGKDETKKESAGGSTGYDGEQRFPVNYKLNEVLQLLHANRCVHWLSEGDWSMHDMLMGILDITGPAEVYISSYGFSEYPARIIADLKARKIIIKLSCLVDLRLDTRSASAFNIVKNVSDRVKQINTHAKVTIIENEKYSVVVVGSANYTTNKRYECGTVIMGVEATAFHKKWIEDAFTKNK